MYIWLLFLPESGDQLRNGDALNVVYTFTLSRGGNLKDILVNKCISFDALIAFALASRDILQLDTHVC